MKSFENSTDFIQNFTKFHQPNKQGNSWNKQPIILESSVSYSKRKVKEVLLGIHHIVPNAKLLYIMRDPVERLFSSYRFDFQYRVDGIGVQSPKGFHEYISNALESPTYSHISRPTKEKFTTGQYIDRIKRAVHTFGREKVLAIQFEEFTLDPVQCIRDNVLPFLSIPDYSPEILANISTEVTNPSELQYEMLNETRARLQDYYRPYNNELSQLLDDDKWNWGY